ncbi:MAG: thiamine pyrophosphate-binding protein [Verrucomicrobia bacterium]|nr:thiamine pyrophosphate-binding protein [Verrucomicrobiota bacterium]
MTEKNNNLVWHKILESGELPDGRVTTASVGTQTFAVSNFQGQYGALTNACPHQSGPLGEGSIETGAEGRCWLRCPWHGWDFDPITGESPGGHGDHLTTFPIEERDDGIYLAVEEETTRARSNSDVMAETMVNWGIKQVFGMVGHSNLGMADALRVQEEAGNLNFYGVRHEGAAAFACSGYAKLTGRPAACFTIAGPGATNLMTGLYDAKVDRAPLLAITGQVDTQVLGPGAFQEVDLIGAFKDVSAFNHTVYADSKHGEIVSLALKNALLTRNPVTLVLPNEVQEMENAEGEAGSPEGRIAALDIAPPQSVLDDAVAKIKEAKRPILIIGHGARFDMDAIISFAEKLDIPVLTTFKAKGLISDNHPLGCGVLGRSGTPIASWFMNECDRIIAVGASFSNHTGIASYYPIIQIDFDPMALGKFHSVELPVLGEIGRTFEMLHDAFPENIDRGNMREEVAERWKIWREEKESRVQDDSGKGINAALLFAAMTRQCQDNAIIAVDVGNNTYSFGRYFEASGDQAVLMSGYLGSIGFGYSASMGAWAATQEDDPKFKDRPVWVVSGDGGFGQYLGEVLTAVKYIMNLTHVLMHNDELGKISKEQRAAHFEVWKTDLHNPNFAEYVNLCGGKGIRVTDPAKLDEALAEARDYNGPATVEVMTDALLV